MFGYWKNRVNELESQINDGRQEIAKFQSNAQALFRHGKGNAEKFDSHFQQLLDKIASEVKTYLDTQAIPLVSDWEESEWENWEPSDVLSQPIIRIGKKVEQRKLNGPSRGLGFSLPEYVPFIGENKIIIIRCSSRTNDQGLALLQSLIIRTALMLPHQARYTLLDPAGNGAAFPMFRQLKESQSVRELDSNDVCQDLETVKRDIQRINAQYLDAESRSFEKLPEEFRINERFEFIFAADFPDRYDRRAIEALQSVGNTGPRTGKYLFIHYNQDYPLPRDMTMERFKNPFYINLNDYGISERTACDLRLFFDKPPSPELQNQLFEKLRNSKPPERKLDWGDIVGTREHEWWKCTAEKIIQTPIGASGRSDLLNLWFGENNENRPCAHGMLGAMTGAGKSNLYHVFISGLAIRYSPKELRMYLIDGKEGVEFQPYRHLPHAEVVSLHSLPQLSRSVLSELVDEKEYRNTLFTKAGVANLKDYRRKGQPGGNLPRILLIVDEYQELFEGDQDGKASNLLLQLASQGRSAGIHMLLASQRFGVPGMMHQANIFTNIHLRMAMQMSESDRQSLTEFGRRGRLLIGSCDLPGKIVINDRAGDDGEGANRMGKVVYLESADREELINRLRRKAHQELKPENLPLTVVFDGIAQPNLIENPQLLKILETPGWMTPKQWQDVARKSIHEGGLNIPDWFSAERPAVMWLGQEFSVRGQAMITTRRRHSENLMIIGSNFANRYGMLVGILTSLAVNAEPKNITFTIFDRSMAETQWFEVLQNTIKYVLHPAGFQVEFTRDRKKLPSIIDNLVQELERRIELDDEELLQQSSIFVLMTELDQVDEIRRKNDGYGLSDSPNGKKLQRLYAEGSRLGIHLILSFSGLRPMINVIDERQGLVNFRHRVALQMSEDESFTFMRNRNASLLQMDGSKPICALYMDSENEKSVRFKPYSIESDIPLVEQLTQVGNYFKNWREKS